MGILDGYGRRGKTKKKKSGQSAVHPGDWKYGSLGSDAGGASPSTRSFMGNPVLRVRSVVNTAQALRIFSLFPRGSKNELARARQDGTNVLSGQSPSPP